MKKLITISILILAILTSLLAGTLSYYTLSLDRLAGGSVTAKAFIFLASETREFTRNTPIAPSETVDWAFKVYNYDNSAITETYQYDRLTFTVEAAEGKEAILPLTVSVLDPQGQEKGRVTGTGSFSFTGEFPLQDQGQSADYQVVLHWPGDGSDDAHYASSGFGTAVRVSAFASQLPLEGDDAEGPEDPDQPGSGETEKPQASNFRLVYRTARPQQESTGIRYQFSLALYNQDTQDVNGWQLAFHLPETRLNLWDNMALGNTEEDRESGNFVFTNPAYWNLIIPAGGSLAFPVGGHFIALDGEVHTPQEVTLNGQPVTVEHIRDFVFP